ncbi:hypothetical protein D9757_000595 [Collybiopsis confluens]|uniref:t-SNARE coiled-coil homology domain-containing protein n=1 Tax=Collybiopsis confluens TaxID=2823264 RepID=A0A8H5I1H1_9AGAR|nr:hypothetical protein D9757_000595 [Collybiopsis confluens]
MSTQTGQIMQKEYRRFEIAHCGVGQSVATRCFYSIFSGKSIICSVERNNQIGNARQPLPLTLLMNVTTRSRTGLFLSYRDSAAPSARPSRRFTSSYDDPESAALDDEQQGLIAATSHSAVDIDLPPKWVDISEQVQQILADTQTKIAALEKLHAKHALPGFSDRSLEEQEIEAATSDITKDFRHCQSLIQQVVPVSSHSFPPPHPDALKSTSELQAAKNLQRGLAAKVQDLSATFRKKQRVYMEKLQGHAIKNQDLLLASGTISLKGSAGMNAVDEDVAAALTFSSSILGHSMRHVLHFHLNSCRFLGILARILGLLLSHSLTSFVTSTLTNTQSLSLRQADPNAVDFQTRDRELGEIAKSIASLAELFKDLSVLVIDQGTLLDSVEYNIEQTAVQVKDAVQELNTATRRVLVLKAPLLLLLTMEQIPEEYRPTAVHIFARLDHRRSHYCYHFQTKTPLSAPIISIPGSDTYVFNCKSRRSCSIQPKPLPKKELLCRVQETSEVESQSSYSFRLTLK